MAESKDVYEEKQEQILEQNRAPLTIESEPIEIKHGTKTIRFDIDGSACATIHPAVDCVTGVYSFGVLLPAIETIEKKKKRKGKKAEQESGENEDEDDVEISEHRTQRFFILRSDFSIVPAEGVFHLGLRLSTQPFETPPRWDPQDIRSFFETRAAPTLKDVYLKIKGCFAQYVEFANEGDLELISLWTLGTYLHVLFQAYPYVHANGLKATGKSKLLNITANLSFNGLNTSGVSESALFRFVDNSRATILSDESEFHGKQGERQECLKHVYLAGYKAGSSIARVEKGENDTLRPKLFQTYGPKVLGGISLPDDVLQSRILPITLLRGMSPVINLEVPAPIAPVWTDIRNGIYRSVLRNWSLVQVAYENKKAPEGMNGRVFELWKPILALAEVCGVSIAAAIQSRSSSISSNNDEVDTSLLSALDRLSSAGDGYHSLKNVTSVFREELGTPTEDKWPTPKWVAGRLRTLNFTEIRRVGTGREVLLMRSVVVDRLKRFGGVAAVIPDKISVDSVVSADSADKPRVPIQSKIDTGVGVEPETKHTHPSGIDTIDTIDTLDTKKDTETPENPSNPSKNDVRGRVLSFIRVNGLSHSITIAKSLDIPDALLPVFEKTLGVMVQDKQVERDPLGRYYA